MPSIRSTLILLCVAIVMSVAAFLTSGSDGDRRSQQGLRRLFEGNALPVDDINRLTLERRGQPQLVFERNGSGEWRQIEPFVHPVDTFSMRQLAIEAANLQSAMQLEPSSMTGEQSPQALSLAPPLATIRFEWGTGAQVLQLGRPALGGRAYVRVGADGPVHVVGRSLHDRAIETDPKEWRRRELFEHVGADSRVIALTGNEIYGMIREGRTWKLERPVRTRLDQQKVDEFLSLLEGIRASEFVADQPPDLGPFGLSTPLLEFTIVSVIRREVDGRVRSEEVEERLMIGAPRDVGATSYFGMVAGRPTVIALPRPVVDRIRAVELLLAMTASGVNSADVKSIRISGETEFTLERRDDDPARWICPDRAGAEVPASTVQVLLDHLTATPATNITQEPYPLEVEAAIVTMFGFDRLPLDTVRLAKRAEGPWLADNGDTLLRTFPASIELPLTPLAYGLQ